MRVTFKYLPMLLVLLVGCQTLPRYSKAEILDLHTQLQSCIKTVVKASHLPRDGKAMVTVYLTEGGKINNARLYYNGVSNPRFTKKMQLALLLCQPLDTRVTGPVTFPVELRVVKKN